MKGVQVRGINENIGEMIRKQREARGLSTRDMAERLWGIPNEGAYKRLESGRAKWTAEKILDVVNALGLSSVTLDTSLLREQPGYEGMRDWRPAEGEVCQ